MAKKRGRPKGSKNKVYRKTEAELKAERKRHREWPKYKRLRRAAIIASRNERKALPKLQCVLLHTQLRPIIREAARAGLVEAIEHTSNFWNVSEGYKKYIEQQVAAQAEALLAAVRITLRDEFTKLRMVNLRTRKR